MKINQRLFDHYGIDTNKDLRIEKKCPRPFDTILIDKQGSCYACECQSWLPQSIGNLQVRDLDHILRSATRAYLQSSITDGSYRYCNEHQCSYLRSGSSFAYNRTGILNLRLAIDDSCNLRCPSCRKQMIFHTDGPTYRLGIRLADKINTWLNQQRREVRVHMGSDGDPFASHVYRHFMRHTPRLENVKYSVLTNALMFKEFHTKVPEVIDNLEELGVSVDGATRQTYERLRLGGKWEKIKEALECISRVKRDRGFRLVLHFVVQKDNFHEMDRMVDMAEQYGADRVWLNKIEDWGTLADFGEQNIFQSDDFKKHIEALLRRIHERDDRFVECPTLISEEARRRNKN